MKLYIATLIKHDEYFVSAETFVSDTAETFVSDTAEGVASKVVNFLDGEEVPHDPYDILLECGRGNQDGAGEPLSIGVDADLCREFLLTTKVAEV